MHVMLMRSFQLLPVTSITGVSTCVTRPLRAYRRVITSLLDAFIAACMRNPIFIAIHTLVVACYQARAPAFRCVCLPTICTRASSDATAPFLL